MKSLPFLLVLALSGPSFAATLLSDDFDSGAASADWYRKAGITMNAGGQGGTSNYVSLNPTTAESNGLGDVIGGANNFVVDFYFRVKDDAVNRQFNFSVSTTALVPNPPNATINLRYQGGNGGSFAVFTSSWQNLALGSITAGEWYHMQVEGVGWGTAGASYTLRLSAAGGTAFTQTLSGLALIQGGSITGPFMDGDPPQSRPGTAQSFIFSTVYGANPGFDVDNVMVTGDLVPEPSSVCFSFAGAALFVRRRRCRERSHDPAI